MKKKILYITTFYPTSTRPYHGIFFRDHAEALGRYEDVAVLFVSVPSVKQSGKIVDQVKVTEYNGILEIRVIAPVVSHRSRYLIDRAYRRAAVKGYKALMDYWEGQPDVAIAQTSLPAGKIAGQILEQNGIPYGIVEHFSFLDSMIEHQKEEMVQVYRSAAFIGAVSPYLGNLISEKLPGFKSIRMIPNTVAPQFENAAFNTHQSGRRETKRFKWIWVGDDKYPKQPDLLAEALTLLGADQITVTVVGRGSFESLSSLKGLGYDIHFYKNISRAEMPDMMLRHDALISTSFIETFGMAIIEMLSLGRPVAITPSGGPEMFVTPDRGIVAAGHSANDIAESMKNLMLNYNRFDAEHVRSSIINEYGSKAYHNRLLKLINKI